jgi:hypothetical protein
MNEMTIQDLLILTFKNYSKIYDCFNSLSINQIKNKTILDLLILTFKNYSENYDCFSSLSSNQIKNMTILDLSKNENHKK